MNLLIVKYTRAARDYTADKPVVCICDPDFSNLLIAMREHPEAKFEVDYSFALQRFDVDTALITAQDMAAGIALTALAYGKSVILDRRIALGDSQARLERIAKKSGLVLTQEAL